MGPLEAEIKAVSTLGIGRKEIALNSRRPLTTMEPLGDSAKLPYIKENEGVRFFLTYQGEGAPSDTGTGIPLRGPPGLKVLTLWPSPIKLQRNQSCRGGGIGRHARLRGVWGDPCEFKSRSRYHSLIAFPKFFLTDILLTQAVSLHYPLGSTLIVILNCVGSFLFGKESELCCFPPNLSVPPNPLGSNERMFYTRVTRSP